MEWGKWVSQFSDCSGEYEYDVGLESIGLELEAEDCISKADLLALIEGFTAQWANPPSGPAP